MKKIFTLLFAAFTAASMSAQQHTPMSFVGASNADTTPIQRQISCNIQNDKKLRVNANIYSM